LAPEPENNAVVEETYLLARAGAGDREAFRELYSRYSRPLFSLAVRLVGDPGEAEEQVQDAFVKIWQNAASFDPRKSRPFTWAVTITRRTCIDRLRKRRHQFPTAPLPNDADGSMRGPAGRGAADTTEANEDSERLHGALAGIPRNQRNALELALFSEMTHTEIAQCLEQPVGTVKSWIRRGLLGLRATLSDPTL
jgi:RNA polymerase sigma-70 factor (ECF subfamily)